MADITLSHITPQHFFEAVKLLKMTEHRIYLTVDSLEVRFRYDRNEPPAATDKRFQQLEHFMLFLQELVHSDVPIDLDEFIRTYRKVSGRRFHR
ncbi:hypothetical protein [Actinobacillus equuli]|uniref:Uncharacterized protein n=1 Tax=Actinobacillus equuli subsp. equuli TaxID=202947 RepID=A0A9X4JDF0_ACTEU|nr:hypothetical protein [Actinobacillus equuli]MDE8035787.1 hypothetical protein [Actinobacillus equuli subsp. equuli]WGE47304.1 hypothetical protein NYR84_03680 [Actinobacillus equuli subsp. haemolyticus]WGE47314.1 hypothetical protein NYR84_03730 [Actinobacillus equuli subsp. haemolyticus]WGE51526.1 hypothetical protein NYR68_03850 [Actinobacillus equuli subsp. haemolyticus]WGE51535.1 hypothetical protein NYR68_03895 [Actinobacillus equuli subsp. haemolyticus]